MMRWHRWCAVFGALLMAYIAVTGLGIQLADMRALVSGAPATDPDMRMMRQHTYGPPNYAVLSPPDFTADALPTRTDYTADLSRAAAAIARAAVPGTDLRFIELRMLHGREIGHVQMGNLQLFFDLAAGSPITSADRFLRIADGETVSARATFKAVHQFGYLGHLGTGLNGIAAIAFLVMVASGLAYYVKTFASDI